MMKFKDLGMGSLFVLFPPTPGYTFGLVYTKGNFGPNETGNAMPVRYGTVEKISENADVIKLEF